jgi:hypothetical protein
MLMCLQLHTRDRASTNTNTYATHRKEKTLNFLLLTNLFASALTGLSGLYLITEVHDLPGRIGLLLVVIACAWSVARMITGQYVELAYAELMLNVSLAYLFVLRIYELNSRRAPNGRRV